MVELKKPFLGVAYYPEDWDECDMDEDIRKMKEAGIRVARMAEFAWSKMEPAPGKFEFGWLHKVIDKLWDAGIATMLGTPSATPPIWLSQAYPDVTVLNEYHIRVAHGGRRHCCTNHPKYYEYSMRIAEEMAKEFGADERVIGWQIDNEINRQDCRCEYCVKGFREHLKRKYGTIERLNYVWNTNLFSQTYTDFEEIPLPEYGWHNPHTRLESILFRSNMQSKFIGDQVDIIKKYTKAPVGTDTMPTNAVDYEDMTAKCDIMQYNHYDTPEELHKQRFWFDYLRPFKDIPFWNTETSTCWNGSNATTQSVKPYGFCRVNSWLPVAFGGEANMYWLWRTHRAGHEMTHGAVLSTSGRPMHIFGEVQRVAEEFDKASEFLMATKVNTDVALHFSGLAWNMSITQPLVKGHEYHPALYNNFYEPISDAGIRPDVIGAGKSLDGYKLIFTPMLLTLEDRGLCERIGEWVENGGVWVVGPMTDIRNAAGAKYASSPYGMLEELTGAVQAYELPDVVGLIKSRWADGSEFVGDVTYELFEGDGCELVSVSEGYPTLIGKSPLVRKKVGKGVVYLLGTVPSPADMKRIAKLAADDAKVSLTESCGRLAVVPREGDGGEGLIVVDCGGEGGSVELPYKAIDLLTGKAHEGEITVEPYDVLVLKKA